MTLDGDLTKRLQALPTAVSFKVRREALLAGAEPIRAEVALRAPRGEWSGPHLADHIVADALSEAETERGLDFRGDETVVEIGPTIPHFYGYFSEYGTVTQVAHPWFRPAFDTKQALALRIIGAKLWEGIKKFAGVSHTATVGSRNL